MLELRQSTARIVPVGSAVAVADGFTPVTNLTLGGADEAELLKANGAATVDISGYTFAAITDCDGWYNLSLTVSGTDTLGGLVVVVQDADLILPIEVKFTVVTQQVWDSKYGADKLQVDVVEDSIGLALEATLDLVPTVGEIDTELTSNHGSGSWQSAAGVPGVGTVTVTITDQNAAAVIGANVVITDTVGSGNYSGGDTTDGNGAAIIDALATGSYIITATADGYEIPDTAVTISATPQSVPITATKSTVNAPTNPDLCTLYGDFDVLTGDAAAGSISVTPQDSTTAVFVDDNGVSKKKQTANFDSSGHVEIYVLKNVPIVITSTAWQRDVEILTTLITDTQNIADIT